jgi:hypothetical protein
MEHEPSELAISNGTPEQRHLEHGSDSTSGCQVLGDRTRADDLRIRTSPVLEDEATAARAIGVA